MKPTRGKLPLVRHYFVDEAGDAVLFSKRGHVRIGTPGCSHYFILGLLDIAEPAKVAHALENLRHDLLSDPYFKGVPSMQPEANKTARCFHAADDLPEVRREVFRLLKEHHLAFFAVVKNKNKILEYVRQRNEQDPAYQYHENEVYDFLVRRLFKTLLHKDDEYNVCFARRGHSDRTEALRKALDTAKRRFDEEHGIVSGSTLNTEARWAWECPELQAADYFLWALQRLYEKQEERYAANLWEKCCLVIDMDDTRNHRYGEYYTKRNPLSLAALQETPEDIGLPSRS